jgi:photosystem II stability/assembly factor-like uncharacterized protein
VSITVTLGAIRVSPDVLESVGANGEVRQWEITGPFGGDVRSLVSSPDNGDVLYLGTSDGQLFTSVDGARTWHRQRPGLGRPGLSIDSIVIDPRNTSTIYAGAWAVSNQQQGGVFKSEDGGRNWKLLSDTKGFSVRSLAMSPSDSQMLVAGTANDDPKLNGAFRTNDGGKNWERITPEGDKEIRNIESVAIDPETSDTLYLGTWHLPWKSIDGGKNWKLTGFKDNGMIEDSDIFGICINPKNARLVHMNACSGIYRSNSGGDKWQKIEGIPFSARRSYALLPHPTDPTILFVGTSEGLYRINGKNLRLLTSKSFVIRAIVVHPDNPNRVLIATDDHGIRVSDNLGDDFAEANTGFIHRHVLEIMPDVSERGRLLASVFHDGSAGSLFASTNGGESWENSSTGLGNRDVYALYQLPETPETIYAGTNTGVYRSSDRGNSWSFVAIEKPEPVKKPRRPRRRTKRAGLSTAFGKFEAVPAAQKRGTPRSRTRKPAPKKLPPAPAVPAGPVLIELNGQVDDITGYLDHEGRRVLLAATMNGLYRCRDLNKGWEKLFIAGYDPNGRVFAVASHKETPRTFLVGTRQGLYISEDEGETWSHVERGPSEASVKSIAQDQRDPDSIFVGTNRFLYRSTNRGRSWVIRGGGVPVGDFTSVTINPLDPNEVMVADYSTGGIYRSGDKGYTWERIDTELPSSRVWILSFDPFDKERIYAGSFSSGVYVLTVQRGARARD